MVKKTESIGALERIQDLLIISSLASQKRGMAVFGLENEFQKLRDRNGDESSYQLTSNGENDIFISCNESILLLKKGKFDKRIIGRLLRHNKDQEVHRDTYKAIAVISGYESY